MRSKNLERSKEQLQFKEEFSKRKSTFKRNLFHAE